jgi:hypothetical protein
MQPEPDLVEAQMAFKTTSLSLAAGAMALGLAASGPAAQAAIRFVNPINQDVHFTLRCAGDSLMQNWTIAAGTRGGLFCRNGARAARIRVVTAGGGRRTVVRATLYDPGTYEFYYDGEGAVNIR